MVKVSKDYHSPQLQRNARKCSSKSLKKRVNVKSRRKERHWRVTHSVCPSGEGSVGTAVSVFEIVAASPVDNYGEPNECEEVNEENVGAACPGDWFNNGLSHRQGVITISSTRHAVFSNYSPFAGSFQPAPSSTFRCIRPELALVVLIARILACASRGDGNFFDVIANEVHNLLCTSSTCFSITSSRTRRALAVRSSPSAGSFQPAPSSIVRCIRKELALGVALALALTIASRGCGSDFDVVAKEVHTIFSAFTFLTDARSFGAAVEVVRRASLTLRSTSTK